MPAALPVEVEEIADDHSEVVEVPVEARAEPGGPQHHVTEPLDLCRLPGGSLGAVGTSRMGAEVECQWLPFRQRRIGAVRREPTTQQHVEQSLAGLNHALGIAATQYAEAEQANARLFLR